jgi:hypothetical protein
MESKLLKKGMSITDLQAIRKEPLNRIQSRFK